MKNILVPTDFSEKANHAVNEAVKLGVKFDAKVHIIHVYGALKRADTILSVNKLLQREAEEKLEMLAGNLQQKYEIKLRYKAVKGTEVAETIDRVARKMEIDLLVLGSKGEMDSPEIFLGSVAGRLLKKCDSPMLILPHGKPLPEIEKILFAVKSLDLSHRKVLDPLHSIQEVFNAELTSLQVQVDRPEPALVGAESELRYFDRPFEEIAAPSIYAGIERYLSDHPHDLLCVIRRKRGFFERLFKPSKVKKSAFNADLPMLVLQGLK